MNRRQLAVPRWDADEERGRQLAFLLAARRIHRGSFWQYDGRPYNLMPDDGVGGKRVRE